jgi:hypothetical protein
MLGHGLNVPHDPQDAKSTRRAIQGASAVADATRRDAKRASLELRLMAERSYPIEDNC